MPNRSLAVLSALALALLWSTAEAAPTPPAELALELVADGLRFPVYVTGDPARPRRLLVVEQEGRIRIVRPRGLRKRPFLDIESKVLAGGERGLLGMALDPDWPKRRRLYVNYTDRDGDTVIERYRASPNLRRARRRAREVLRVEQPFSNHNGGHLAFGPDGHLYVGLGDGGAGGDPQANAQNLESLLGKMLRIDVRRLPYTVPDDNPELPGVGRTAIWALGLRNPWRFSFDSASGDLYIGDVGQGRREEIDYLPADAPAGANFGWDVREGTLPFDDTPPATLPLIDPIHEYGRVKGRSVTGGYVYRGEAIPELVGHYLYADFVKRRVWSLFVRNGKARRRAELTSMLKGVDGATPAIASFGRDAFGELYVCDYLGGAIYRIVPAG